MSEKHKKKAEYQRRVAVLNQLVNSYPEEIYDEMDQTINDLFSLIKLEEYDDRLAELEAVILQHYLDKGYKLEKDQVDGDVKWRFTVNISSHYKCKDLEVIFYENGQILEVIRETNGSLTTKEMFDKAIAYFKGE